MTRITEAMLGVGERTDVHRSPCDEVGEDGMWRESCPLPFFFAFGRCQCECGKRFWSTAKYRAHWRAENEKLMWWTNL